MMKCPGCRTNVFHNLWMILLCCYKKQYSELRIICSTCGNIMLPSKHTAQILGVMDGLSGFLFAFIGVTYWNLIGFTSIPLVNKLGLLLCAAMLGIMCFSTLKALLVLLLKWQSLPKDCEKNEQKMFDNTYCAFLDKARVFFGVIAVLALVKLWLLH